MVAYAPCRSNFRRWRHDAKGT